MARAPSIQFEKVRNRFCSVGNVLRRLTDSTPVMLSLESRENSKQTKTLDPTVYFKNRNEL